MKKLLTFALIALVLTPYKGVYAVSGAPDFATFSLINPSDTSFQVNCSPIGANQTLLETKTDFDTSTGGTNLWDVSIDPGNRSGSITLCSGTIIDASATTITGGIGDYVLFTIDGASPYPFFPVIGSALLHWNGSSFSYIPPAPTDTTTRVISISPENASTTSDHPDISGTFYNQNDIYNQLIVNLSWVEPSVNADLLLSGAAHRQFIFDIGTSTSIGSFSTTTSDLLTGRWLMSAQFSNSTDAFNYFTATSSTFIVGTTTTLYSDFVDFSTTTPYGEPISDCSAASGVVERVLCSIGDRIKQVFQFLFVPNSTVLGRFPALKDNILSRAPFGYFPLFKEALSGVSASSTAIFSLVIPVSQTPRFSQVRTGLGWVFMFWFVVHMWRRFKHVQL